MSRSKVVLSVIGGLIGVVIVGSIVANYAIDHSSTTRNAREIEAARPATTDDAFCWLYHDQQQSDPAVEPVELAKVVRGGKAPQHAASLGVYELASGRPPAALEPWFSRFATLVVDAGNDKPVDLAALDLYANKLQLAIDRQCTPEHSTTSTPSAWTDRPAAPTSS